MTIKEATFQALKSLQDIEKFHKLLIVEKVRDLLSPRMPYESTISRRMRELRKEGRVKYQCLNAQTSLYKITGIIDETGKD